MSCDLKSGERCSSTCAVCARVRLLFRRVRAAHPGVASEPSAKHRPVRLRRDQPGERGVRAPSGKPRVVGPRRVQPERRAPQRRGLPRPGKVRARESRARAVALPQNAKSMRRMSSIPARRRRGERLGLRAPERIPEAGGGRSLPQAGNRGHAGRKPRRGRSPRSGLRRKRLGLPVRAQKSRLRNRSLLRVPVSGPRARERV